MRNIDQNARRQEFVRDVYFGIDAHNAEREGEGNATYSRNLIAALLAVAGDDRFALFAGDPHHPCYAPLASPGRVRIIRVAQGWGLARLGFALRRAASRARVDTLHVQYTAPLAYGGRLVVTVHDLAFLHVPEFFPAALRVALRVLVPRSLGRASRVIVGSEFVRRDIVARYGVSSDRIAVIPLGVQARFRPLPAPEVLSVMARHGLRPGFIFSLGRLNRRKNLERLVLAYARLRATGACETPLVIAGKPDFGVRSVLDRARLSVDGTGVRFAGVISDADLPAFYNAAACFAYPSLFEGFGLPVLEAMACGTPVVTSDRTALPDLVGDAGLLVDPESVDALAGAIERLLRDRGFAEELGRRGLGRSRGYSWAETGKRTLDVYRAAASA